MQNSFGNPNCCKVSQLNKELKKKLDGLIEQWKRGHKASPLCKLLVLGTLKVRVPKKVVFTRISAHVCVSKKPILKIKLSITSPNVILAYNTYNTSNKKVSLQLKNFKNFK